MTLMSRVEGRLPLAALDRVVQSLSPADGSFVFRLVPRATLARRRKDAASPEDGSRLSPEEGARVARDFLFRPHPPGQRVQPPARGRHPGQVEIRLGGLNAQRLDRVLTAWRTGDPDGDHPISDATGSKLYPGRWNTPASPMIYMSAHYSTAMLEKLVHGSGCMPPAQHFIEIMIPNGTSYETVEPAHLPGWDDPSCAIPQAFGAAWHRQQRSLILLDPSFVARMENNIRLNPDHPEYRMVTHGLHRPVWWDRRLFV